MESCDCPFCSDLSTWLPMVVFASGGICGHFVFAALLLGAPVDHLSIMNLHLNSFNQITPNSASVGLIVS
jgi:hypothetical protein